MSALMNNLLQTAFNIGNSLNAATSNWGSLNNDLIAQFIQIDTNGNQTGVAFKAVIKEGSFEQSFNWQSPFESFSLESKYLGVMGAMQSGLPNELLGLLGVSQESEAGGFVDKISSLASIPSGKSSITKMNSRQIYTGHAPLKITCTLLFRAWQDPQSEVIAPFNALLKMAYPNKMAENLASAAKNAQDKSLSSLFPSDAPLRVLMTYKGETFPPLVIESIGKPLDAPYSPMGDIWLEVPVSFSTYQSMDAQDFQKAQKGAIGGVINEAINKVCSFF